MPVGMDYVDWLFSYTFSGEADKLRKLYEVFGSKERFQGFFNGVLDKAEQHVYFISDKVRDGSYKGGTYESYSVGTWKIPSSDYFIEFILQAIYFPHIPDIAGRLMFGLKVHISSPDSLFGVIDKVIGMFFCEPLLGLETFTSFNYLGGIKLVFYPELFYSEMDETSGTRVTPYFLGKKYYGGFSSYLESLGLSRVVPAISLRLCNSPFSFLNIMFAEYVAGTEGGRVEESLLIYFQLDVKRMRQLQVEFKSELAPYSRIIKRGVLLSSLYRGGELSLDTFGSVLVSDLRPSLEGVLKDLGYGLGSIRPIFNLDFSRSTFDYSMFTDKAYSYREFVILKVSLLRQGV